ncbi:MAG: hypothetical protein J1F67_02075 [Muribaculaceae bacterium]|nr:hypothetical protein [Muribaculaceae bacterium]
MNKTKSISFGDKIFARVTRNGHTIYNFVSEKVSNMADLLSQIRLAMKDIHGLVMIHIRNFNQGWGDERPLMLYARKVRNYSFIKQDLYDAPRQDSFNAAVQAPERKMLFPWETH